MAEALSFVLRGGADALLLAVLLGGGYRRRRPHETEMVFVLVTLNVGLFATVIAIAGDDFTAGAGFGLFGLLSLIRLRSASFTTGDMAYAFTALVLGLLLGLPELPFGVGPALGAVLVAAVVVGDHPGFHERREVVTVVLDRAHRCPEDAVRDLEARLALRVVSLTLQEVDYVRETTTVVATCAPGARARHWEPA